MKDRLQAHIIHDPIDMVSVGTYILPATMIGMAQVYKTFNIIVRLSACSHTRLPNLLSVIADSSIWYRERRRTGC